MPEEITNRERYLEYFLIAALLTFGTYHSVLYFGHKVVPNSDFPAFFGTGQELLSFQVPSSFKRVPVLGLLQVGLSYLVGGQHPGLTAGWLLNAILHPFNLILLWWVGREIVGKSALWLAIVAILNPHVIYLLTEPIVETTFLFFILLTFYLIFKRSKWSYLFASITSMVRYEGAALILAAFVMDVLHLKNKRRWVRPFVYSALASVPLGIWLLGTFLTQSAETTYYLKVFTKKYAEAFAGPVENRIGIVLHMKLLWLLGFQPLFTLPTLAKSFFTKLTSAEVQSIQTFFSTGKVIVLAGFAFGSIYGLFKRQWNILMLLIFFVPYFLVHAHYPYPIQRFHSTIFWIAQLLCWFGLQSGWKLIDRGGRMPKGIVLILQALVALVSILWLVLLVPYLPKISPISPKSASMPYVAMLLVGLIFAGRIFVYTPRYTLRELSILVFVCSIIVSNQFSLVWLVGNGQADAEFKQIADWYIANARPGEKLLTSLPHVVRLYAPKHKDSLLSVEIIKAESPSDFTKKCYEEDITYVVWDSRLGLNPGNEYYKFWGLQNIAMLDKPRDIGPYEFITQLGSKRGYVNIFRLRRPPDVIKQEPQDK